MRFPWSISPRLGRDSWPPPGRGGGRGQPAGERVQLLLSEAVGSLPTFSKPVLKNIPRSHGLAQLHGWSSSPSRDINSRH